MTIRLSREQIVALRPCSVSKIPHFGRFKTMTAKRALETGVSIEDLLWVAAKIGRKDLCVKFALACAQRTAYLNPDPRVQASLDATQRWIDRPCKDTAREAREAAGAAAGAAAGEAAGAAARAARAAAAWAARAAAAGAAREAAWAARAAGEAAGAAEKEEQKRLFLEIFQ